jgi:anti-sigma factor RsiW
VSGQHLPDEQLSRLLDGDLSLTERGAVLDHVGRCAACAQRQSELVEVAALLRSQPAAAWTADLTARVLEQLPEPVPAGRRTRLPVASLLALLTAVIVLGLVIAVPVGLLVSGSVFGALATLPPVGVASPSHVLIGLIVVACAAPLFAYPLARWR